MNPQVPRSLHPPNIMQVPSLKSQDNLPDMKRDAACTLTSQMSRQTTWTGVRGRSVPGTHWRTAPITTIPAQAEIVLLNVSLSGTVSIKDTVRSVSIPNGRTTLTAINTAGPGRTWSRSRGDRIILTLRALIAATGIAWTNMNGGVLQRVRKMRGTIAHQKQKRVLIWIIKNGKLVQKHPTIHSIAPLGWPPRVRPRKNACSSDCKQVISKSWKGLKIVIGIVLKWTGI